VLFSFQLEHVRVGQTDEQRDGRTDRQNPYCVLLWRPHNKLY